MPGDTHLAKIKFAVSHRWDLMPEGAIQLQRNLASMVSVSPLADAAIQRVGGVDVGFPRGREIARASVAVFEYPGMDGLDHASVDVPITFPYVPGLLSFREIPAIFAALEKLTILPDLLITDGHGYAHPRRFGLACHLGVCLDLPTIGCAKSILVGEYGNLGESRGSCADLVDGEEIVGAALRTRDGVKPVFVSVGHNVDLPSAVRIILNCGGGYRLPKPTLWAHRLASTNLRNRPPSSW